MWDRTEKTIFVVAFIFIALFTRDQLWNPNDLSRMAGVESIVERGTFAIDNSTFVNTIDKVKSGEHYYSDKPAMSYIIAVPAYYALHRFFDLDFVKNRGLTYYWITLLTIGLGVAIMLVYFYRLLARFGLNKKTRVFYTAAMFLGTLVFTYSLIYNSHGLVAAWLVISLYLVLSAKKPKQYFFAGVASGFTAMIDLVTGNIFAVLFLILLFFKNRRKTLLFVAGAMIPIIIAIAINVYISGSIMPFNVNPQLFDFSGSAFGKGSLSGVVMQSWPQIPAYAFDLLLGKRGFFLFTPVLIFSFAALIMALYRKKYRDEAIIALMGFIATFVFYITRTNNYGGCSYGLRWTVPLIPIIFYFTPVLFEKKTRLLKLLKIAFFITLIISAIFTFVGAMEPWTCSNGLLPEFMVKSLINKFS